MRQWIALALIACSVQEIRSSECRVACQYLGYNSGAYQNKNCHCIDIKNYADTTNKQIISLGKSKKKLQRTIEF